MPDPHGAEPRGAEIRFDGVGHTYGERTVLVDIDLTLSERRIGIVGVNGGGKSTLARMINGLVVPTAGTVTVDGLDTRRKGAQIRRRVGFCFTDPDTQIVMPTVAEDVDFSLRRSGLNKEDRRRRVDQVLERYGLADHADHPCHLLSGGQKQLLALAAVLVIDPSVIVADEPTTLLDLRNRALVAEIFAELPQQLVVVTHDLDLVSDFDRVLVVDGGRVVIDDAPAAALAGYRRIALRSGPGSGSAPGSGA
ncbi:ABC transporter ATP-binding protein [Rhodococcus sp. IEGM 1408]|uniref:energy-coupling factor ABC transporter ATP-binding protein n=1 Tax=Rhodococcus sp. IEGM 1408 TaxID=3082220 RepID=UPI0029551EA9|nr:ABC transporter ATP-binding protein [Rhodococcus sp. IEGM 1408]MDV8001785.1 ABC transporter ATP-binding protein [Rhodococcus sp. IEGM 1408]